MQKTTDETRDSDVNTPTVSESKPETGEGSEAVNASTPSRPDAGPSDDSLANPPCPETQSGLMPGSQRRSHSRWWLGVICGMVASLPFGWLLSYAGTLPLFLGIFFFALFGLVIGAVMYRIASPARPYSTRVLVAGTAMVVLLGWSISVAKEGSDFPSNRAQYAGSKTRDIGGRSITEYQDLINSQIREYFRVNYSPGGPLGYIRWTLTNGVIRASELEALRITLRAPQRPIPWLIRVVLSLALFAFGVSSQTIALRRVT